MFAGSMLRRCLPIAALVLALSNLGAASECRAEEYGAFILTNTSSVPIHYQVKWGDAEWKPYCLYPDTERWHAWELNYDGTTPKPYVRFDSIGGDGDTTYQSYNVGTYRAHCSTDGKRHNFRYSHCGTYLDLYAR
jgi:hypothetical protein